MKGECRRLMETRLHVYEAGLYVNYFFTHPSQCALCSAAFYPYLSGTHRTEIALYLTTEQTAEHPLPIKQVTNAINHLSGHL